MSNRIIFLMVVSLVLISLTLMAQPKTDRVLKVDGSVIIGHVVSVDEAGVKIGSTVVPRAQVKSIDFNGAKSSAANTPAASNSQPTASEVTDLIMKRFGGALYGHVSAVNENEVIQNGTHLPRGSVATIQFNVSRPEQVITITPSPSPSPSPSASPSPAAGSGNDAGGDTKGNEQKPATGGTGRAGPRPEAGRVLPPWFGKPGKDWCPGSDYVAVSLLSGGVLAKTNADGVTMVNCFVDVQVCSNHIHKEFGPIENGPHACEEKFGNPSRSIGLDEKLFVCCSRLKESKDKPGIHCDGTKDIDCDGIPDDQDDFPFDPNCSERSKGCHSTKSN